MVALPDNSHTINWRIIRYLRKKKRYGLLKQIPLINRIQERLDYWIAIHKAASGEPLRDRVWRHLLRLWGLENKHWLDEYYASTRRNIADHSSNDRRDVE